MIDAALVDEGDASSMNHAVDVKHGYSFKRSIEWKVTFRHDGTILPLKLPMEGVSITLVIDGNKVHHE